MAEDLEQNVDTPNDNPGSDDQQTLDDLTVLDSVQAPDTEPEQHAGLGEDAPLEDGSLSSIHLGSQENAPEFAQGSIEEGVGVTGETPVLTGDENIPEFDADRLEDGEGVSNQTPAADGEQDPLFINAETDADFDYDPPVFGDTDAASQDTHLEGGEETATPAVDVAALAPGNETEETEVAEVAEVTEETDDADTVENNTGTMDVAADEDGGRQGLGRDNPNAGPKGNEGLGNGEDAPPPGHDENMNDGDGAAPGDPNANDGGGNVQVADAGDENPKGNEGLGNGEDAPPPGHDENMNDGDGAAPGDPNANDGGNAGQTIQGTGRSDTLTGGDGDDTLVGKGGDDILDGGAGNDTIDGGSGNDLFIFGSGDGSDYFDGGNGWTDTVMLEDAGGAPGGQGGWTLQVDEGVSYTQTAEGIEFDGDASGSIQLSDGSELTFEGVDKIEW